MWVGRRDVEQTVAGVGEDHDREVFPVGVAQAVESGDGLIDRNRLVLTAVEPEPRHSQLRQVRRRVEARRSGRRQPLDDLLLGEPAPAAALFAREPTVEMLLSVADGRAVDERGEATWPERTAASGTIQPA